MSHDDKLDIRAALATHNAYLIDKVIPRDRVHLLAGISSAGKSRFAIPALMMFSQGFNVLGLRSTPVPWCIIANDRPLADVHDTIRSMGFKPSDVDIVPNFGRYNRPKYKVIEQLILHKFKLVLWEGLDLLVKNPNNSYEVAEFLSQLTAYCEEGITVLGTVGVAKLKHNEGYDNPRQLVAGSSVWERCTSTNLIIVPTVPEDISDPHRLLYVSLKNEPSFTVSGAFDHNGILVFDTYENRHLSPEDAVKAIRANKLRKKGE